MKPDEAARAFIAAWNADDDSERQRLFTSCSAADARFVSPQGVVSGLEAFSTSVGAFRRAVPKAEVVLGRPDRHFGYERFRWEPRWHDGREPLSGQDGMIQLVVSCDGSPQPLSDQEPRG